MLIVKVSLLVVLGFASNCYAEAQFNFGYPGQHQFRAGLPLASLTDGYKREESVENRFFFTTLTVTMATSTYTSTFTTSTTCTTSTSNLKSCSPSKGRRRRSQRDISSLLYNEAAEAEELDPNVFIIPDSKLGEDSIEREKRDSSRIDRKAPANISAVPFVIQPGHTGPENIGSGRFLLAFGTLTVTTSTTSTYSFTLTAVCKSSTGFLTCGNSGK